MTAAGTGADYQATTGNGLLQGGHNTHLLQNVGGAGRALNGFVINNGNGVNQGQPAQAHVFHGPCGGTNVAGVGGVHHYNVDLSEHKPACRCLKKEAAKCNAKRASQTIELPL